MTQKILITSRIPDIGMRLLEAKFGPPIFGPWDISPTEEELADAVAGCDALLCMLTDPVTRQVLARADRCRVVSNYAVGFDNVDVAAATELGIVVTNTPGVLTETTADLAFALLLAAARRIGEGDRLTRAGRFTGWSPMPLLGQDVYGATLGIVGAGRIGQAVARRAAGFGMTILYTSRSGKSDFESRTGARRVELDTLLSESDFVSLHVPYREETHHLIGVEELRRMKPTAVLVNTARGAVVDEAALVLALRGGEIFAAGLDVYEREPDLHPGLAELENVTLLPHLGSASVRTRGRMAVMAARNLIDVLEGRRPEATVNPEVAR